MDGIVTADDTLFHDKVIFIIKTVYNDSLGKQESNGAQIPSPWFRSTFKSTLDYARRW